MSFELFLAKRFLVGQRFGVFRTVTTLIAVGGTALGVAALLITLAVMDGFRIDIQEKILGTQPHMEVVQPFGGELEENLALAESFKSVSHILGSSPFISAQALIQSGNRVTGILLRGINPSTESQVINLKKIIASGSWSDLNDSGIVLGQELAQNVSAHVGSLITLITPQPQAISMLQAPRMRQYKVVGTFHSGMYEYDANLVYMTVPAAQNLLGWKDRISGYGLRLDDVDEASRVETDLQKQIGLEFWVRSWEDRNVALFSAMKLERTVMFLILTLIILVSSFTIISNLLLLTIEKAREIGILQALGASPQQVGRVFLYHGLMLGGSGVGIGLILGVGISALLKRFPLIKLPADVYYIDKLPIRLSLHTIESVAACAFTLVLLSILYPARKAQQMDPVQVIRYG